MEATLLCKRTFVHVTLLLTACRQDSHCAQKMDAAFPHIYPNRLQFFDYESIWLNCSGFDGLTEWIVKKQISSNTTKWENSAQSLNIYPAFEAHSGEYWCENGQGERSSSLNITVSAHVILEIPALPVMEHQTLTLHCRTNQNHLNLAADFYKNGEFIQTGYEGKIIFPNVSSSNEGLYKCSIHGRNSPESWLAVRAYVTSESTEESIPLSTLLSVFFSIMAVVLLLSVSRFLYLWKTKAITESDPIYENGMVADPSSTIYVNVPSYKNRKGHHGKRNKRTSGADKTMTKERVPPGTNVLGTNVPGTGRGEDRRSAQKERG